VEKTRGKKLSGKTNIVVFVRAQTRFVRRTKTNALSFLSFFLSCCSRKKHKTRFFIVKVGCGVAIVFVVVSALRALLAPVSKEGRKKWSHHHHHHHHHRSETLENNNTSSKEEERWSGF
jgi:hypothetical protein|tara:strand:+ start:5699 stop:6055 length:357 start_codon:yes stop_codon:yes gene_type:complete